jgi:hypothetical protein
MSEVRSEPYVAQEDSSRDTQPWSRPPDDDAWSPIPKATDAEDAAETFAEKSDRDGEYSIVTRGEGRVWVKSPEGEITRWNIRAESVPSYYGRAAK